MRFVARSTDPDRTGPRPGSIQAFFLLALNCRVCSFQPVPADVTQLLDAIDSGDPKAADHLLPLVYDELRKLAAAKMAQEKPGQTLQATALVHEAWLRLVGTEAPADWNSRGHFFETAADWSGWT